MFGVLYGDLFRKITDDFTAVGLYQIKLVDKYHFEYITADTIHNSIIKNILGTLREMLGIRYDIIIASMQEHKMEIAGSFVLQCALDEYWQGSDIDFYTYAPQTKRIFGDTVSGAAYYAKDEYSTLPNITHIFNYDVSIEDYPKHTNYWQPKRLQVIHLEKSEKNYDIESYVNNTYDFSVCKNIFRFEDGKPVLKIGHLSNVMNKETRIDLPGNIAVRGEKYLARGFKFIEEKHPFINYAKNIVPIIYCNMINGVMRNKYFLGQRLKKNKYRTANLTIKYFENDAHKRSYDCCPSGIGCYYDDDDELNVVVAQYYSITRRCPVSALYDHTKCSHKHKLMSVVDKKTGKTSWCDVVIIIYDDKLEKDMFDSEDTYEWLGIHLSNMVDMRHTRTRKDQWWWRRHRE